MGKLLTGERLEQRARQLGIDIEGDLITTSASGRHRRAPDYELQRRIIEAERSRRESQLWLMALISALASVASAVVAAILAIAKVK